MIFIQNYRHSCRCLEFDAKLLMNHSVRGVKAGYVTRHKLLRTAFAASSKLSAPPCFLASVSRLKRRELCEIGSAAGQADERLRDFN
jgi:hypothetical protein